MEKEMKNFRILKFTVFSFLGWLFGVVLIIILSSLLDSVGIEDKQFYLGIGMGSGVGFMQWLYLRRQTDIEKTWIWLSAIGMGLPFIVYDLLPAGTVTYKLPLFVMAGGLCAGILQYFILKHYSQRAAFWIAGCFAAWALSVYCINLIEFTRELSANNLLIALLNLILILSGGILLGMISGIFLKRVLHL